MLRERYKCCSQERMVKIFGQHMKIMMGVHCSIGSRGCWSTTIKPQADTTKNTKEICSFSFCQHGQSVCKNCYLRHQMSSKEAQSSIKCLCESDEHCFSPETYTPLPSNTPLRHQLEMTTAAAPDESYTSSPI